MIQKQNDDGVSTHLESVINYLDSFCASGATPKDYKAIGGAVSYLKFFQKHYEEELKNAVHLV